MIALTDFHSHILPGIDDGSAGVDESLQMLRVEAEQNIHTVVATPHFYAHRDRPEAFLKRREHSFRVLEEAMADRQDLPRILCGAEVFWFPGMGSCEELQALATEGTRTILVEMPPAPWTSAMYRELENLREKQGLVPIVAHIDRYIRPFRTHGIPQALASMPVLVQANAGFFLHKSSAALAFRLLKQETIHLLGSDCHNLESRRPNLGIAADRICAKMGNAPLERIRSFEERILGGE